MPGSPKNSLTAGLLYDRPLLSGYDLGLSLNGVYRSAVKMQLAPTLGSATVLQSSSYGILNASAAVSHGPWRVTTYVTNLTDKQEVLVPPNQGTPENNLGMLANDYVVNQPREVGARLAYSF